MTSPDPARRPMVLLAVPAAADERDPAARPVLGAWQIDSTSPSTAVTAAADSILGFAGDASYTELEPDGWEVTDLGRLAANTRRDDLPARTLLALAEDGTVEAAWRGQAAGPAGIVAMVCAQLAGDPDGPYEDMARDPSWTGVPRRLPWVADSQGRTANLEEYEVRGAGDPAKRDDELYHAPWGDRRCGVYLCDVQPDDTLATLAGVALDHSAGCPAAAASEGRRIIVAVSAQLRAARDLSRRLRADDTGALKEPGEALEEVCRWLAEFGIDPATGLPEPEWDSADSQRYQDEQQAARPAWNHPAPPENPSERSGGPRYGR